MAKAIIQLTKILWAVIAHGYLEEKSPMWWDWVWKIEKDEKKIDSKSDEAKIFKSNALYFFIFKVWRVVMCFIPNHDFRKRTELAKNVVFTQ